MGVPNNSLPTAEKSGQFNGRETVLGVCDCGCGQAMIRFADDNEVCGAQTALARVRAVDDSEGIFDKLVAQMPSELRSEAEEAGMTAEEATALALCARPRRVTRMIVVVGPLPDDEGSEEN